MIFWYFALLRAEMSKNYSLGQGRLEQSWDSMFCPWQSRPPKAGTGLVQVLVLVWVPPPHLAEHSDQTPYSLHSPSTEILQLWYIFISEFSWPHFTNCNFHPYLKFNFRTTGDWVLTLELQQFYWRLGSKSSLTAVLLECNSSVTFYHFWISSYSVSIYLLTQPKFTQSCGEYVMKLQVSFEIT